MATLAVAIVQVTPFQQNCAVIHDKESKRATVVDPGGDVDAIAARVAGLGVTVDQILLTHGHLDHAGGAADLAGRLGVKVLGPDFADLFLLRTLPDQARLFGMDEVRPVVPDRWLKEGETVSLAGVKFSVLHCPGHTPGHVVFVSPALRFAVLGDVLFRGSVGRTDFPYGDHDALIGAIRTKLLPLGDDVRFICGHGPGSTLGEERRTNPFLREGPA